MRRVRSSDLLHGRRCRGARPAYLLRESYREGARVRKRTLANLSALSDEQILAIRTPVPKFEKHGPLSEAVLTAAHDELAG